MIHGRLINQYYQHGKYGTIDLFWVVRTIDDKKLVLKTLAHNKPKAYFPERWRLKFQNLLNTEMLNIFNYSVCVNHVFADFPIEIVWKLECHNPKHINTARNLIKEKLGIAYDLFEADIPFVRQEMIERKIFHYVSFERINHEYYEIYPLEDPDIINQIPDPHAYYVDFETDDRYGFEVKPKDKEWDRMTLSFSDKRHTENIKFFIYPDEELLAKKLYERLDDIDEIIAHNGDNFDFTVMKKMFRKFDIDINWRHYAFIDHMTLTIQRDHTISVPFVSLDKLGKTYLGLQKIKRTKGFYELYEDYIYKRSFELESYNNRDIEIMVEMEKIFGYIAGQTEISNDIGLAIGSLGYISRIPDMARLRKAREYPIRVVYRSKPHDDDEVPTDKYSGATVLDPIKAWHRNVFGADLTSMYNRIMQCNRVGYNSWNHETKRFDLMPFAIEADACEDFEAKRNVLKELLLSAQTEQEEEKYDRQQYSKKTILLTIYGDFGNPYSRCYNPAIAEEITLRGRMLIIGDEVLKGEYRSIKNFETGEKETVFYPCPLDPKTIMKRGAKQILEEFGCTIVYGDTDSVYFKFENAIETNLEEMNKIVEFLIEEINKEYTQHLIDIGIPETYHRLNIAYQGYYPVFMITAKKFYYTLLAYDGEKKKKIDLKPYVKGYPMKKFTAMEFNKQLNEQTLTFLAHEFLNGTLNEEKVVDFLMEIKQKLFNGYYNDLLVLTSSTKQNKADYKTKTPPPHVRAALIAEELGQFTFGERIQYVVAKRTNDEIMVEPVILDVMPKISKSGYQYYWNTHFYNYIEPLLELELNHEFIKARLDGKRDLMEFL